MNYSLGVPYDNKLDEQEANGDMRGKKGLVIIGR